MFNQYDLALKYYTTGSKLFPNEPQLPVNHGRILQAIGKYPEAEVAFKTAIQIDPVNIEANFELGRLFRNFSRNHESLTLLNKVLSLDNSHCGALLERCFLLSNSGDISGAKSDMTKMIDYGCQNINNNLRSRLGM